MPFRDIALSLLSSGVLFTLAVGTEDKFLMSLLGACLLERMLDSLLKTDSSFYKCCCFLEK